ncbi:MAG: RNA polymerase sigma factor [Anaerolineae bacterium]|nr:RNA polymerase sigma factor [Anaerolineae bacterium]
MEIRDELDEKEAVARMAQGDISGLETLVYIHQVRAVRAAYLIIQDRGLAEEVVQAAFIRAFERIAQFDGRRPFAPWFFRSVVNDALKAVQRNKRTLSLDSDPDGNGLSWFEKFADSHPGPENLLEKEETRQAVQDAIQQLPPSQRALIVLKYYLGMSEAEMVEETDVPAGTVKWRLYMARKRLRQLLAYLWIDK